MITPQGTAACEAESEHSLTKEGHTRQKWLTFNTWQQLWMLHSRRGCHPFLAEFPCSGKPVWMRGVSGKALDAQAVGLAWEHEPQGRRPESISREAFPAGKLPIKKWVTGEDWVDSRSGSPVLVIRFSGQALVALEDTHPLVFLEEGRKRLWCGHWLVEVEREKPEEE